MTTMNESDLLETFTNKHHHALTSSRGMNVRTKRAIGQIYTDPISQEPFSNSTMRSEVITRSTLTIALGGSLLSIPTLRSLQLMDPPIRGVTDTLTNSTVLRSFWSGGASTRSNSTFCAEVIV